MSRQRRLPAQLTGKAQAGQPGEFVPVGGEARPLDPPGAVDPKLQAATRRHLGVELADRTRRGVPGVGEDRFPCAFPAPVQRREFVLFHVDFPARREEGRGRRAPCRRVPGYGKRNVGDGPQVRRHVLPPDTVSPRGAPGVSAILRRLARPRDRRSSPPRRTPADPGHPPECPDRRGTAGGGRRTREAPLRKRRSAGRASGGPGRRFRTTRPAPPRRAGSASRGRQVRDGPPRAAGARGTGRRTGRRLFRERRPGSTGRCDSEGACAVPRRGSWGRFRASCLRGAAPYSSSSAAIPGRCFPSSSSRKAPPPVETYDIREKSPALWRAVSVSPRPRSSARRSRPAPASPPASPPRTARFRSPPSDRSTRSSSRPEAPRGTGRTSRGRCRAPSSRRGSPAPPRCGSARTPRAARPRPRRPAGRSRTFRSAAPARTRFAVSAISAS